MEFEAIDRPPPNEALFRARTLLRRPRRKDSSLPALGAAALFALSAIGLVVVLYTGQPPGFEPVVETPPAKAVPEP